MNEWFDLDLDLDQGCLRLQMTGFWSETQFDAFGPAFESHINQLAERTGGFLVLVDLRGFPAQTEASQQRMQRNMHYALDRGMIKAARLVASATTALQVRRLADAIDAASFRDFTDEQEALAWLFEAS